MMRCPHCGLAMLDGFKFCHHCGKSISISTAAPELAAPAPLRENTRAIFETEATETEPPEPASDEADFAEAETPPDKITVGRMYLFELLCRLPLLNILFLSLIASSVNESPLREIARAKLLTMLTVAIIFLLAALIVVLLMHMGVIEPVYLGKWR